LCGFKLSMFIFCGLTFNLWLRTQALGIQVYRNTNESLKQLLHFLRKRRQRAYGLVNRLCSTANRTERTSGHPGQPGHSGHLCILLKVCANNLSVSLIASRFCYKCLAGEFTTICVNNNNNHNSYNNNS